ncbi:MAG TPA: cytochrome ubiquinol oxidase subunit I [Candidatus Dormibacteraeota bacterium]|nr:cytochrome ubiquinol oxidase subunit I [Candidatus Dormibacteraeota bacterium]
MTTLADAVSNNLDAARDQMGVSLGWHIIVASLGVGFPIVILVAEWRGVYRGDAVAMRLARVWSRTAGVLFAVGAVSGTIISFEMGILWPGFLGTFGDVIGLPFALEGFAFFIEAIFVGVYLYGWNRLSARAHLLTGIPIAVSGVLSAFFVVTANAWMNDPRGFRLVGGKVVDPDPWKAMFNAATPPEAIHLLLASMMVTGFLVAGVYAWAMARGRRDRYHRLGFAIPFVVAAAMAPAQVVAGDFAARYVADRQPAKLAALEAQAQTEQGAGEHIGGVFVDGRLRFAIVIPHALAVLARGNPNATIAGLDSVPAADQPPVNVVHTAFDLMVGIGFGLLGLAVWFAWAWWRTRALPASRWFLWGAVAAGPAAVLATEAGWVTTEVGRQPWIVYGVLRVDQAVSTAPGLFAGFYVLLAVYTLLTVATFAVLLRLRERPAEPVLAAGIAA